MVQAQIVREGDPPRWAEQLGWLSDDNLEQLRRNEELGQALNFSQAVDILKIIREFLAGLAWQDPRYEPAVLAGEVSTHLVDVRRIVDQIRAFTPTDNAAARHQNLITTADNERSWFAEKVGPVVRAADSVQAASAHADLLSNRRLVTEAAAEAQRALVTIREAAGEKGTTELATFFATQASGHERSAFSFLRGATLAVVGLFIVGWFTFIYDPIRIQPQNAGDWIEFVRQLLPRLFALGAIAYVIRFAVRGYGINKHLQVTNEQRANILKTYPALVASGQTEVQKDRIAVLLAQAAVASVDSGYLNQSEDKGLDSQILAIAELVRR